MAAIIDLCTPMFIGNLSARQRRVCNSSVQAGSLLARPPKAYTPCLAALIRIQTLGQSGRLQLVLLLMRRAPRVLEGGPSERQHLLEVGR